jgi:hypothetical protein
MPPVDDTEAVQRHMLELYVFADKRGVTNLANDAITMLASWWANTQVMLNNIGWLFPLISHSSKLYQLLMDNLILEIRHRSKMRSRLVEAHLPGTVLIDILLRGDLLTKDFFDYKACFQSACHYHIHNQQGGLSEEECVDRIEAGKNVWPPDIDLRQHAWRWE